MLSEPAAAPATKRERETHAVDYIKKERGRKKRGKFRIALLLLWRRRSRPKATSARRWRSSATAEREREKERVDRDGKEEGGSPLMKTKRHGTRE